MLKAPQETLPPTGLLKVLGDPTRLRILGLLALQELSVGELSRALGLSQSRVSNHLRVLRETPLLAERRVGSSVFLALGVEAGDGSLAGRLWSALEGEIAALDEHERDLSRLRRVLSERRDRGPEFFDRVAGDWDTIGTDFASGQARQRAVAQLVDPGLVVADLGCGTGYVARALLGVAAKVIAVDASEGMLEEARRNLELAPAGTQVELRRGELDALPIADGEVDGAIAGMVMHHLPSLDSALSEMRRILRPGGTAVVLDLEPHREAWLHDTLGDRHLGLEPSAVVKAMERAGFEDVRVEALDDRYRPRHPEQGSHTADLPLFLVRGRAPRGHVAP
ncbi:MAG: metalloregulator ArsR/SmtB family transcription factor [Planctomycetes bacterium]|nr:ArsR family transcriptional regulator [Planctomycetota bacterium]MCB9903964.1 metalloregulator ArsR/SmtB family transcription factor [Planctomycetota bacterium]